MRSGLTDEQIEACFRVTIGINGSQFFRVHGRDARASGRVAPLVLTLATMAERPARTTGAEPQSSDASEHDAFEELTRKRLSVSKMDLDEAPHREEAEKR
jgi:hypothetical protein